MGLELELELELELIVAALPPYVQDPVGPPRRFEWSVLRAPQVAPGEEVAQGSN